MNGTEGGVNLAQGEACRRSPYALAMDWIVCDSPAARELEALLARVAGSDAPVLIQGESGTGKTRLAREIHRRSSRVGEPLVEVQLGALAPSLIESELFGHAAGAFTGAQRAREGRFQRAGAGTLVLEGVDALGEELQTKLLRVLQERRIEPVGSEESLPCEARVIATSTRELRAEVAAGRFRGDLYFRLAVVVIDLPPLRLRREDLARLSQALLASAARRMALPERRLSGAALERLLEWSWPGNLRELENALERALVLGGPQAGEVAPSEFDFVREARPEALAELVRTLLAQGATLPELERALVREALRESRGSRAAAARALGISRRVLEQLEAREEGGAE